MLTKKAKVLIVDDVAENIQIMMSTLKTEFSILAATNGKKALELVDKHDDIDVILLDIMMPDMDGYEVCKIIKSCPKTERIPIIFITALNEISNEEKGLELGAVDYLTKPINTSLVLKRVKNHVELKRYREHLEDLVNERTKELKQSNEAVIEAMGIIAEKRDSETGDHIQRIKQFVKLIAKELSKNENYKDVVTDDFIDTIYLCSPLHDLGKVAIKDSILLKEGKLTPEEFEEMKKHTTIGEETLIMVQEYLSNDMITISKEIASSHHENWDGSGYPKGLKGSEIPLSARILAIADVYDAMINKRVYKKAMTRKFVLEKIQEYKGIKFDPEIVDAFFKVEPLFENIIMKFSDKNEKISV